MSEETLPASWANPPISDCCDLNPKLDKSQFSGGQLVHFVPMPAVEALTNKVDVSATRTFAEVKKGYTPFTSGDVLFAKITPCMENGKMVVVPDLLLGLAFGSTEFHVIRPRGGLDPLWFFYFVSSRPFRSNAEHNMTGAVGQRRVPIDFIARSLIPLPPLAEQKRIVAKIEELFSELEAGEESLRVARRQLGVYRQSLLKQAFEGHLTAKWRTQNPAKLESSGSLLARVQSARQSRYEKHLKEWEVALSEWKRADELSSKPRRPSVPETIAALPTEIACDLAVLPSFWFWGKLALMTLGIEYGTGTKSSKTGSCPVIRMGNLQGGEIDWDDLAFTSDEAEIAEYRLTPGDVLFNRTNSPEWVGKTAIYRGNRPAVFAGYLMRVNHIPSVVCSGYLNYFLNSGVAREYGNSVKTDGVNQSNINGVKLAGYPFPYCSLPEQQEIVRLLDEQFEVIERNEREIDAALKRSEALRQAILKKAFTGRLVLQDPSDEPASALLARLRSHASPAKAAPAKARRQNTG